MLSSLPRRLRVHLGSYGFLSQAAEALGGVYQTVGWCFGQIFGNDVPIHENLRLYSTYRVEDCVAFWRWSGDVIVKAFLGGCCVGNLELYCGGHQP